MDNLVEWIGKNQDKNDDVLRCLIFVNINFVLYHTIFSRELNSNKYLLKIEKLTLEDFDYISNNSDQYNRFSEPDNFIKYMNKLKANKTGYKGISDERMRVINKFIDDNLILFKSDYFANKLDISKNVDNNIFQKINNFIETGILINE